MWELESVVPGANTETCSKSKNDLEQAASSCQPALNHFLFYSCLLCNVAVRGYP